MITEWEALKARVSCRAYSDRPLDGETVKKLKDKTKELGDASGLTFRFFILGEADAPELKLSSSMFSGKPAACAALIGAKDPLSAEKVGYYGQKLTLFATQLGLGTCWVAGTFDRKAFESKLTEVSEDGEKLAIGGGRRLWDVIPIGYAAEKTPVKQRAIRTMLRKKDRSMEKTIETDVPFEELPEWLKTALTAVKLGPSAANQQPVNVVYRQGEVSMRILKNYHDLEYNDLGIAKCQFEVGAASAGVSGRWEFGDGGRFIVQE